MSMRFRSCALVALRLAHGNHDVDLQEMHQPKGEMNILQLLQRSIKTEIASTKQLIKYDPYKQDLPGLKRRLSQLVSLQKALNAKW